MVWLQIRRALCGMEIISFGLPGLFFLWVGWAEASRDPLEVGFEIPFFNLSNQADAALLLIAGLILLMISLMSFLALTQTWNRIDAITWKKL